MQRVADHLETLRLTLRKPRIEDAAVMFAAWTQDPAVTRYLTWRPHEDVRRTESFIIGAIEAWSADERAVYVITTHERDVPIGLLEVRFESSFAASIGYVLQRSAWNRGFMTEVCTAVIDSLFTVSQIWRVWAYCDVENGASARVLERSGMQHEGVLRRAMLHPNLGEVPRDVHIYARVRRT
jgi:RimJ/RimL family protein N-acetyltransferase